VTRLRVWAVWCLVGLALLTQPGPGSGQGTPVLDTVSVRALEDVLDGLNIRYEKSQQKDREGRPLPNRYHYRFARTGREVTLFYYNGKELMLQHRQGRLTLDRVNAWNVAALFSRAYTDADGSVLEWTLDCGAGVTRQTVRNFIQRFDQELVRFERFVRDAPVVKGQPALSERFQLPVKFLDGQKQARLEVTFPLGQKDWRTAWRIEWHIERGPVPKQLRMAGRTRVKENVYFRIKSAWFRAGPTERDEWIQVLDDLRVSELFVPYNDGKVRWWDVLDHGSMWPIKNERAEAGPRGQVLGLERCVVGEVRDRGLLYKDQDGRARRGQTFVLWANLNAGNYNYLIEYGFQDDGTITCRLGATGRNLHLGGASRNDYPRMGHMHNTCWRIGLKLGPQGQTDNTAYLAKHVEQENGRGTADQVPALFNDGFEGAARWVAEEFTRVRIENGAVTAGKNKKPIAYDLVPLRQGTARHHGNRIRPESFTLEDFWVTRADSKRSHYVELPQYFAGIQPQDRKRVVNTDLVVWYMSSALHEPRSEDGLSSRHGAEPLGPATVAWSGFELRPRHIFTNTPLFPPEK
jgi:primary-amine oxidase